MFCWSQRGHSPREQGPGLQPSQGEGPQQVGLPSNWSPNTRLKFTGSTPQRSCRGPTVSPTTRGCGGPLALQGYAPGVGLEPKSQAVFFQNPQGAGSDTHRQGPRTPGQVLCAQDKAVYVACTALPGLHRCVGWIPGARKGQGRSGQMERERERSTIYSEAKQLSELQSSR